MAAQCRPGTASLQTMHETLFANANVITLDPSVPRAGAVVVRGGRVAALVAKDMPIRFQDRRGRVIDCSGKTMLPGFIDAHCHIAAYAGSLVSLDLSPRSGVCCIQDIQEKIRGLCARIPPGTWIRGKGYDEFHIKERRHPHRRDLDAASPENPVKLTHRSGHAHVLNSLALQQVGIDSGTGDPPEGMIDRDLETGIPTGLLYGMNRYLSGTVPGIGVSEFECGLQTANRKLLSYGITSVQDASFSNDLRQWNLFESWKERDLFLPRLTMMLGADAFSAFDGGRFVSRRPGGGPRLGSIKIVADRVTGSLRPPREELDAMVASVHDAGLQVAIHAVEEPVVEAAVASIENAVRHNPRKDARHRIEHCSVCRPEALERLARVGGMVVTQPVFLFQEGARYLETVPSDQLEHLYPIDGMIRSGLRVGAGSDAPVADPNPLVSIGAAVALRSEDGRLLPGRGILLIQAIRMHTTEAAAANFEEHSKGSISPGKMADFVVLSEDPFTVPPERVQDIRVVMTVLGGAIAWNESGEIHC